MDVHSLNCLDIDDMSLISLGSIDFCYVISYFGHHGDITRFEMLPEPGTPSHHRHSDTCV